MGEDSEAFRDQVAGLAHSFECGRAMQLDLPGLALRRDRRVDVAHLFKSRPCRLRAADPMPQPVSQCKAQSKRRKAFSIHSARGTGCATSMPSHEMAQR